MPLAPTRPGGRRRGALVLLCLLVATTASCTAGGQPSGGESPSGGGTPWKDDRGEPYPFVTPIPPATPTPLDGTYGRILEVGGKVTEAIPCRRCAPYRLNAGTATLTLERGRYHVDHPEASFRSLGHFIVRGDEVELFNDPNCPGVRGAYAWQLEQGTLTFIEIEDPCPFDRLRARYLTAAPWLTAE